MKIYWLFAFIINYGLNIAFVKKKVRVGSFVTKALLTPLLLLYYLSRNPTPELLIILALFCGFVGDISLEFPHLFLPGLTAFLTGHIFYGIGFLSDLGADSPFSWWLLLFAALYSAYGVIFCTRLSIQDTKMRAATSVYCGIILLVSFLSLLRAGSVPEFSFWMVLAGTLLFIASDSILAYNRFQKRTPNGGVWVMVTYGAAQLFIILGL